MKHTPGPYIASNHNAERRWCIYLADANGNVRDSRSIGSAGCCSNATLFAGSPDLLTACRAAIEQLGHGKPIQSGSGLEYQMRAAVLRATGKTIAEATTETKGD